MPRNELRTLNLPIADELGKRAGIRPRVRPQECAAYAIAGRVPKLVFSPRSVAEASKTIATVAAEGAAIIIRGAGTKQFRPPPPYDVDVALDASRCQGMLEYEPADLTATVAAGTRFADLQETLRSHNQFFANDPPFAGETTIGGMLSSRSTGALRQHFGSPRDQVLGMRVCLSDGSIAFTGSKVVKSVAGYDIPKLFVGAWGTLGFIGEVTLKVTPIPQHQRGLIATFARCEAACGVALQLASSPLFPLATTLHDPKALRRIRALGAGVSDDGWTLVVRCAGTQRSVTTQADGVAKLCRSGRAVDVEMIELDRLLFAWTDIAELAGGEAYPASQFVCCKIAGLPSQTAEVCTAITRILPHAELTAHPPAGVLYASIPAASHELFDGLDALLDRCEKSGWGFSYLGAPPELASRLRFPTNDGAPIALMRHVKAALDPSGTFDPGRLIGGI